MNINQTHYGSGDNVAGNKIIFSNPQRVLDNNTKRGLLKDLSILLSQKDRKIIIGLAQGSDSECIVLLDEIKKFLLESGFKLEEGVAELYFIIPARGIGIVDLPGSNGDLAVWVGPKAQ